MCRHTKLKKPKEVLELIYFHVMMYCLFCLQNFTTVIIVSNILFTICRLQFFMTGFVVYNMSFNNLLMLRRFDCFKGAAG